MVKYICDICGKEIDTSNPHNYSKYKLKNYTFEWDTWFWKKANCPQFLLAFYV